MAKYILKKRSETNFAIHHHRAKIGSVWVVPSTGLWSAVIDIRGQRVHKPGFADKSEAFHAVTKSANRIILCGNDNVAAANEALDKKNLAVREEVARRNKAAGAIVSRVSNRKINL
jgi:hypothetical protein